MCGGSANSRCLPSTVYGERTNPAASRPPFAIRAARSLRVAPPVGRLEADAVRGAAGDDQDRAGRGGGAAAVAEHVAALDRVHVEDRRADPQRAAVAEPQLGADPRAERRSPGSSCRSVAELGVGQVRDPDAAGAGEPGRRPRRSSAGRPRSGASPCAQRQVQRDALDGDAGVAAARPASRRLAGGEAVAPHRGQPLQHHPRRWPAARSARAREVVEPADGVDRRAGSQVWRRLSNGRHGVSTSRSPSNRCATSATSSYVPTARVSTPSRAALRGEPAEAEAVAVALGDRHQAGVGVGDLGEVRRASGRRRRTGSGGIACQPRALHVEVERLVEQRG